MQAPKNIRVHTEERLLELVWNDDSVANIPLRTIRQACPCAGCIDEFTHEQILDPNSVPLDIAIEHISMAGNYALKIRWTDKHDTGLFTWQRLKAIGNGG